MQQEKKPADSKVLLWILLSLAIGLGLGLLIGWILCSVSSSNATLADLPIEDKEEYIILVAEAYAYNGDLEKAQERLARLDAPNIEQWIVDLTERAIAEGRDDAEIQALASLAQGLGVDTPQMVAYLATPTPRPTDTPRATPTAIPTNTPAPTDTPLPPTDTPVPPTDTPQPTATDTQVPPTVEPTETLLPPTDTPKPTSPPQPTNTPAPPKPTNTPQPPAAKWRYDAWLVGPGQDAQGCDYGNLQIRVTVVDANGGHIGGVWVHDRYSGQYQLTGNVDSPDWGIGETKFEYGIGGGGSLCIADGQGGGCQSDYTRDLPCYNPPSVEDLHAAGYCDKCCEVGASLERCRELVAAGKCMGYGHYSWRVVFKRSW